MRTASHKHGWLCLLLKFQPFGFQAKVPMDCLRNYRASMSSTRHSAEQCTSVHLALLTFCSCTPYGTADGRCRVIPCLCLRVRTATCALHRHKEPVMHGLLHRSHTPVLVGAAARWRAAVHRQPLCCPNDVVCALRGGDA